MRKLAAALLVANIFFACSAPRDSGDTGATDAADAALHDGMDADASAIDSAGDAVATDVGDAAASVDSADATAVDATDASAIDASADVAFTDARDADAIADTAPPIDAPGDAASGDVRDASSCVPVPESCFDAIDDDCDGLVDCADPDCTPVAECVPDPGTMMEGTLVATGASCPSAFGAGALDLTRGLDAPTTCTGCSCMGAVGCSTVINLLSSSCGLPAINAIGVSTLSCNFLAGIGSAGGLEVDPFTTLPYCNSSGTPMRAPLSWSEQQTLCTTSSRGGGCGSGMACVPVAPSGAQHCVTASDATSCATGYTAQPGGPWYTGVIDARACGSSCGCTTMGTASCGTSYVALYSGTGTCSTSLGTIMPGTTDCTFPAGTARAQVQLQDTITPSCMPNTTASGTATPTGATTVCCD